MKPFLPDRIVGGSVVAENKPVEVGGLVSRYRAVDLEAGRRVVVCEPARPLRGDHYFLKQLRARARAQSALAAAPVPRLLQVYGEGDRACALVEDYVGGTCVADAIRALNERGRQLEVPVALAVARAVGTVFAHAEAASPRVGLQVTPDQIWIDPQGAVRVAPTYDVLHAEQDQGARSGAIVSLPIYMAPEELFGAHRGEVAPQRTMYSFGLLLHMLLSGSVPNCDGTFIDLLNARRDADPPSVGEARSELPFALICFVDRCARREPAERFETWSELLESLDALSALEPPTGPHELQDWTNALGLVEPLPELDLRAFDGWELLPRSGWGPVDLGERLPPAAPEPAPAFDAEAVYRDPDGRPMYRARAGLLIDARPVTAAEFERFLIQTQRPYPDHWEATADPNRPARLVSIDDARAYADWARKRLPSDPEWEHAVNALGAERLGAGAVWEWTATHHAETGMVVRGGRWRDRPDQPPNPAHRSCEVGPASDLGFRCVVDG